MSSADPNETSNSEKILSQQGHEPTLDLEERKFAEQVRATKVSEARADRELQQKVDDAKVARLTNPLFVGVIGAVIAAFTSIGAQYLTGQNQIAAEQARHGDDMTMERFKAESMRISEAIKSDDELHTACHLSFLFNLQVITDENLLAALNQYLRTQKGVEIAGNQPATTGHEHPSEEFTPVCTIRTASPAVMPSISNNPASDPVIKSGGEPTPGKLIASVPFETDWLGGGHNQAEACQNAVAANQSRFPGKLLRGGGASEDVRKDIFGHVTYKYHCTVNVYEPT